MPAHLQESTFPDLDPWPASFSPPDWVLHTLHTPAPKGTQHLLQEPLIHAVPCLCILWAVERQGWAPEGSQGLGAPLGMEQCELGHWQGRGRTFLHPEQKDQNPLETVAEEGA